MGGKPRIVSQQYLGTAEEVMARLAAGDTAVPERTQHRGFGDVAAVWTMLERLEVAAIIDEVVGARRADADHRVGEHNEPREATMKVSPYHSSNPSDPDVFHDYDDCPTGKQIPSWNKVAGTSGSAAASSAATRTDAQQLSPTVAGSAPPTSRGSSDPLSQLLYLRTRSRSSSMRATRDAAAVG